MIILFTCEWLMFILTPIHKMFVLHFHVIILMFVVFVARVKMMEHIWFIRFGETKGFALILNMGY